MPDAPLECKMEYDEQGRQTRVAYFGADDRPTRVGPSDADTFLVVSEGGADYHAANTHYLSEGAVMHTYANERGEAMENSDGCGWTAKRALPAEGREIELCVSLDGLTYMTDDILTYADGSSRWLHCEVAGDVRCELLELDVHQNGDWRALEEESDELAEVKREVLGIEDVSLDDASEYVPGC